MIPWLKKVFEEIGGPEDTAAAATSPAATTAAPAAALGPDDYEFGYDESVQATMLLFVGILHTSIFHHSFSICFYVPFCFSALHFNT